jgi:hypothetical protein
MELPLCGQSNDQAAMPQAAQTRLKPMPTRIANFTGAGEYSSRSGGGRCATKLSRANHVPAQQIGKRVSITSTSKLHPSFRKRSLPDIILTIQTSSSSVSARYPITTVVQP